MSSSALPNLSHVGLFFHDLERMVAFYTTVFGLKVTARGVGKTFKNELAFLSARPEQHHQLVLASGRPVEATFSTVMQLSFMVQDIDALRRVRSDSLRLGATQMRGLNHGNALSIYFSDPRATRSRSISIRPLSPNRTAIRSTWKPMPDRRETRRSVGPIDVAAYRK
jgi:catechol 2,3-dioxygenase